MVRRNLSVIEQNLLVRKPSVRTSTDTAFICSIDSFEKLSCPACYATAIKPKGLNDNRFYYKCLQCDKHFCLVCSNLSVSKTRVSKPTDTTFIYSIDSFHKVYCPTCYAITIKPKGLNDNRFYYKCLQCNKEFSLACSRLGYFIKATNVKNLIRYHSQ